MYQPAFPQYAQPYGAVQYQQPSMQQMPMGGMQQPQQSNLQRGITGRMVGAPSDIAPQELPMDGSVAYFPTQDGTAIYARALNPDFTVSMVKYVPAVEDAPAEDAAQPTLLDVLNSLDDLKDMVKVGTQPAAKPARRTARKGSDDESE